MTEFTPPQVPQLLKDKNLWLVWRLVQRPGEPKPRKVPFYANGRPRNGEQGSPEDVGQLVSYDQALAAVRSRGYTGLGFAPLPGCGIVALDFDHCVKDGVILDSRIEQLVCETYAEISPSGTGLRAFFAGELRSRKDNANKLDRLGGVDGAPRKDGKFDVEFFGTNGFVTITGHHTGSTALWGLEDTVLDLTDDVKALYRDRFGDDGAVRTSLALVDDPFFSGSVTPGWGAGSDADLGALGPTKLGWSLEQAREYLFQVDASCSREQWLNVLMSVHYEFDGSDDALDLVDEWSATGDSYAGRRDVEGRWHSFGRRQGGAPITGRWLLAHLRESTKVADEVALRNHLQEMQQWIDNAPDMLTLQATVIPQIAGLLLEQPLLEVEAYAFVAAKAKQFKVSITKAEFKRMVKAERPANVEMAIPLTEFGNAERMIQKYDGRLMFCADQERWYVWTGVYWRAALGGRTEIEHYAKETIKDLPKEIASHSANQEEFFAFCSVSQRAQMVAAMVKLVESDPRICVPSSELDKHSHLLGVKNGVVNLRTGDLLEPDPKHYITLQCDAEYNPGAKCPSFEKALRDAFFNDTLMVDYMARALGYSLLGDPREQIMFVAFGNGSNGKSTILNGVLDTLGSYAKAADPSSFLADGPGNGSGGGPREDLVRLRGARFIYVNEPDGGGELREGLVKSMTGGDKLIARGVHAKSSIEITPTWSIWMPTNHKPIIKGSDNGIWRRLAMLPFTRNYETDTEVVKDKGLTAKIASEKAGILAFLVRAGLRYQETGLKAPVKVLESNQEYRKDMDILGDWLEECCLRDPEAITTSKELWMSWETFARSHGMLNYIRSSVALGRRLEARFPAARDSFGNRGRKGLRLKVSDSVF